jgi:hypothetical protein
MAHCAYPGVAASFISDHQKKNWNAWAIRAEFTKPRLLDQVLRRAA